MPDGVTIADRVARACPFQLATGATGVTPALKKNRWSE
jgi:hypothetical protein